MVRKVLTVPNPVLNQKSKFIKLPLTLAGKSLAHDLLESVHSDSGSAGLAAPQVGENVQMVVVTDPDRKAQLLINPKITLASGEKKLFPEGCLSIPGELYLVERYPVIKYTFQDRAGRWSHKKATGWEARVIQHEIDHLQGVLINTIGQKITKKEAEVFYKGQEEPEI